MVVHEHVDGETYANIKLIMPDRSAEPLKPSGKFVRAKDRQKDGNGGGAGGERSSSFAIGGHGGSGVVIVRYRTRAGTGPVFGFK